MAVAELLMGSVILPRSESPRVASRLAEFEWFHNREAEDGLATPEIDDLLLRAQKAYQRIDDALAGLGIPLRVGIMEILFKGTVIKRRSYEVSEIEGMVRDLEEGAAPVEEAERLMAEKAAAAKSLSEYEAAADVLRAASGLDVDVGMLGRGRRFFTALFVVDAKDWDEASRALEGAAVIGMETGSKERRAAVVVCDAEDSARVLGAMRALGYAPFAVPEGLPQVPGRAFKEAEARAAELAEKIKTVGKEVARAAKKSRAALLAMHENALVSKEVLEALRKPGGTRNFALIQGYIPKKMEKKFRDAAGGWTVVTEEAGEDAPVHLDNPRWVRTYEVITQNQGIPKRGEYDPTWMISLMWPIFYGIMFADVGHGLLLMALGLLFKMKGQGSLARWGMLLAMSGGAGALAGFFQGEVFGFALYKFAGFEALLQEGGVLHPVLWMVGAIKVAELTFEQVILILKVSIFLGIIHLAWAFVLRIRNCWRAGERIEMFFEAIPNLVMWLGVIGVMLAAIGSGYDVTNMYSRAHAEPVPWVTAVLGEWAVVWVVVRIAVVAVIVSMVMMIIGGILHNKRHPDAGGDAISVVMEVLLGKVIECLAHTISYARIGIMLLVHAALLLTVNSAYRSMGGLESPGALALVVGGQIGIMMIEGLIVYIQSLRLHLYEFFTKWYAGGAAPFRQLVPETVYNRYAWRRDV
ncbi:MAG: ATPase [Nitrosopumilus sp.]|nr:ATPase [Nitrosopumilus sp.]